MREQGGSQKGLDDLLLVLLFLAGIVFALWTFWNYLPPFRDTILLFLTLVRALGSLLVLDLKGAREMLLLAEVLVRGLSAGVPIDYTLWKETVLAHGASPLRIGLVCTALAGGLVWYRWRTERGLTEKQLVRRFRRLSQEDLFRILRLELPDPRKASPLELARRFHEARQQRNIPPNVVARKLGRMGEAARQAISFFDRLVTSGEVMRPVGNREELDEMVRREIAELKDFFELLPLPRKEEGEAGFEEEDPVLEEYEVEVPPEDL